MQKIQDVDLILGKIPWSRKWPPAPVFLPGKFHGQRILAGYNTWSHQEMDRAELLNIHTYNYDLTLSLCKGDHT